ncbi:MAG TPA: general secretion pathway protein GspB [Steroidobacter sp.]|uniref:general secretion pathway protein GspB n=1 Tax=Steroidobacter sp. TaxID=1978227 RepID=UPI002ED7A6F3
MSFILDALKKSENERQRQVGPSLADVRIHRRHAERPWWVVAVAALLVVNLGVLLFVLIRDGDAMPTPAQQAPAPVQNAPQQSYNAAPPPQAAPQQSYNAPAPAQQYQYQYQYQYQQPQARQYQPELVPTDPSVRSLADEAGGYQEPYPSETVNQNLSGAAVVPEGPPMVRQIQPPAVSPLPSGAVFEARTAANPPANGALVGNETLPTFDDLTASGTSLPELHLDIHVNAQNPGERFVFVNMRKYVEGETLKEGPTVERIIAEGVVLNQRGLRFLLPRQ